MLALLPGLLLSAPCLVGVMGRSLAKGVWLLQPREAPGTVQAVSPWCCELWVPREGGPILLVLSITEEQPGARWVMRIVL